MLRLKGPVKLFDRPDLQGETFTAETNFGDLSQNLPVYYSEPGEPSPGPVIGSGVLTLLENRLEGEITIQDPDMESTIRMLLTNIGGTIGCAIVSEPPMVAVDMDTNYVLSFTVTKLFLTVTPADPDSKLRVMPE